MSSFDDMELWSMFNFLAMTTAKGVCLLKLKNILDVFIYGF